MEIKIWGKYQGRTEEIDTAADEREADQMVQEYRMAYGVQWLIWKGRKRDGEETTERSDVRLRTVD